MDKKKRLIIIVVSGVIILSIILFLIFRNKNGSGKQIKKRKIAISDKSELIEYDFFYQSVNGDYLIPLKKKIKKFSDMKEQIKEVIIGLFEGVGSDERYINLFSSKIKLNNLFIVNKDIVVVDINREIFTKLLGSSIDEILTIYSIVDTICFNFPYIKGVQIIVDGRQMETLSGHIDISRPLRMDARWIRPI
jgi:germination protein M